MADVHLAVQLGHERFAKLVVEKRGRGAVCRRADLARGFLGEARLLARLSHPNVVQVLDLGTDETGPFVVVEYLSGETLSTVLGQVAAAGDRMPWPLVLRMAASVAAGLAAAHGARDPDGQLAPILHRDLTPSNVLLCYTGATKIIDFGIARLVAEAGDTRVGMVKGKLSYLAPELLAGGPADPRCDLFQLGILLHESLTGRRLFDAASETGRVEAVLERPIHRPGQSVEGLPAEVDRIVLALLERDPARRTATAERARADLEELLRTSGARASEHDLGEWLRATLPAQLARRRQRELECMQLAGSAPAAPPAPAPRRPRWKRRILRASALALSGLVGTGAGASLGRSWPDRDPAGEQVDEQVEPAGEQVEPADEQVKPAGEQVAPADEQVAPADEQVAPAEPAVRPRPVATPPPHVTPLREPASPSVPPSSRPGARPVPARGVSPPATLDAAVTAPVGPRRAAGPGRDPPPRDRSPRDRAIDRVQELESPGSADPPPETDNIDPWAP